MAVDWMTVLLSIVTGGLSGAGASILASRSTDRRREREAERKESKDWRDLERRYPKLIAEMRTDVSSPAGEHTRNFFLKTSGTVTGIVTESFFEYHTDVYPDALAGVHELERLGYVRNLTPAGTPMYRMTDPFVDRLKRTG
jgi:hypothetical protein